MNQATTLSPFHRGEREVQTRLGVRDSSENIGKRFIRGYLPAEHKTFFSQLPFVLIGAVDSLGRPWASILIGRPGFIDAPDAQTLEINTRMVSGDPLQGYLSEGADVGLLGIEYHSRRRNRLTGKVAEFSEHSITITIDQTFGNCPQYIQARDYEVLPEIEAIGEPLATTSIRKLDDRARQMIAAADHFYIATHYSENEDATSHGADVSHRGGKPGFVRLEDDRTLTFPDFIGNNHFNTIGNIFLNPRAGLLFMDFESGDLLYLTCKAEITWDSEETRAFVGAERFVRLTVDEGLLIENAVPVRWDFQDYSPSLSYTGSWQEVDAKMAALREGNQYRNYRVLRVERESNTITSFYLEPEDDDKIACHVAGQFLPIEIELSGAAAPLRRTYTISSAPNGASYRLSIKREPPARPELPPGQSSNYFHDHVARGTVIRALSPRGKFTLDESSTRPVVFLSGGIGITPMISMLEQLVNDSHGCGCTRPVWFIHGAMNSDVHAFGEYVRNLAGDLPCLNTHFRYSKPSAQDIKGEHYDSTGYVDTELLKSLLPLDDYDFYLCGPPAFMESLFAGLKSLSVPDKRIHYEFFGPGTTLHKESGNGSLIDALKDQPPVAVQFARSGINTTWDPSKGTLLDLAESEGLQPAYSCRSGICQTCATKVSRGSVAYVEQPMVDPGECTALICSAYPGPGTDSDDADQGLVLDL
jgi:ferredoxin-NADP reductase/predicted pyridoxine 5'-phosphate oxidase superfamily flavin-nucleotide-binding protein